MNHKWLILSVSACVCVLLSMAGCNNNSKKSKSDCGCTAKGPHTHSRSFAAAVPAARTTPRRAFAQSEMTASPTRMRLESQVPTSRNRRTYSAPATEVTVSPSTSEETAPKERRNLPAELDVDLLAMRKPATTIDLEGPELDDIHEPIFLEVSQKIKKPMAEIIISSTEPTEEEIQIGWNNRPLSRRNFDR